jgi:PTH2 family peptidyl-tRNA hydrolase
MSDLLATALGGGVDGRKVAAIAATSSLAGFAAGWLLCQRYGAKLRAGSVPGEKTGEDGAGARSADDDDEEEEGEEGEEDDDFDSEAEETEEDLRLVPEDVELKMVFGVRQDLNMSKGKVAAQVGHATLSAYKAARYRGEGELRPLWQAYVRCWERRAQAKITLKVDDEKTLLDIAAAAAAAKLPVCVIEDAGRTEIPAGSKTVVGIGPAPKALIDAITGPRGSIPLKLLA